MTRRRPVDAGARLLRFSKVRSETSANVVIPLGGPTDVTSGTDSGRGLSSTGSRRSWAPSQGFLSTRRAFLRRLESLSASDNADVINERFICGTHHCFRNLYRSLAPIRSQIAGNWPNLSELMRLRSPPDGYALSAGSLTCVSSQPCLSNKLMVFRYPVPM
jgi:hypothetical protein